MYSDFFISISFSNSENSCPSAENRYLLFGSVPHIVIISSSGITSGRAVRVCGQMGTMTNAFKCGDTTGPPAESP